MRLFLTFTLLVTTCSGFLFGQADDLARTVLGPAVNSDYNDGYPVLSADGNRLWFTRESGGMNIGRSNQPDIWVCSRINGNGWSRSINIGAPVNTPDLNRVLAVNSAGTQLYLLRASGSGEEEAASFLVSHRTGRLWQTPQAVPIADTLRLGPYSSLSVGPDEKVMVLSQRHPNDASRYDLYVSHRDFYGMWAAPIPLGPQINTSGQERKVHLAADGRTLYFSSNGHGGLGGTDILRAVRLDNSWTSWSEPELLPAPFSSSLDDDGFSISARAGYVILAGKNEEGQQDLFTATLPDSLGPQGVCLVNGEIKGISGQESSAIDIVYYPEESAGENFKTVELQASGVFTSILPLEAGRGQLLIGMPGFFPESFTLPDTSFHAENLDRESSQLIAYLRQDREYENREAEIIKIYGRLSEVEDEVTEIDRALSELNNPGSQGWPVLDSTLLYSPPMDSLRLRYEPYFDPNRVPGSRQGSIEGEDSLETSISRRLNRVRSRFLENRARDETENLTAQEAGTEDGPSFPGTGFDHFSRRYWDRQLNREGPLIRYSMEAEMIGEILREENQKSRQDITKIQAMEARLATVLERREDLYGRPGRSRDVSIPWRDSLQADLAAVLDKPFEEKLRTALEPRLEDFIQMARRKFNLNRQRQSLQADLDKLLARQIELEQAAMQEVLAGQDAIPAYRRSADSTYREQTLVINPTPVEVGKTFVLTGLEFFPNSPTLRPESFRQLDLLIELMKETPNLGMSITCHTHSFLSHIDSQNLTRTRARTLSNYIREKGIPSYQLRSSGLGKLKPRVTDDSLNGRRANQRVEVSVYLAAG